MSFLRKRRGSQCSFANGDDEITVRKLVCTDIELKSRSDTIQSARSSCSSVEASDFAVNESCVIRNFPKHKSSHLQFLAWVAYTRKYTDVYISDDERRTCPLAWCREKFNDQEAMLQHVWNCPHLAKGIYHCFQCNKIERVGKSSCKRCQGTPSRKDRMASVAKKIFSKLGAKPSRSDHISTSSSLQSSEHSSEGFRESKSSVPPYSQDPSQQNQSMSWSHPGAQELGTSNVIPEMAGESASYELPDTFISEMAGSECPIELGGSVGMWEDNFYAETFEEWDWPSLPLPKARGSSPKLEIDTSVAYSSRPANWTETPLSATFISPMSAFGNFQTSNMFSPIEISPTDSDTSGMSYLTDSGYSSATTQSATFSSTGSFRRLPSVGEMKGKKREFGTASEAWIKDTAIPIPQDIFSVVANPVLTPNNVGVTISKNHPAGRCTESPSPKLTTSHWHDAPSLVLAFSQSLDAHIQHTKSRLQDLLPTSTTTELISMSRTSIVSIGLEVLTGILEGRTPTAMTQIFAFTHIACALAIAIDDDEAKILTQKWFQDTLRWSSGLRGGRQQKGYEEVAKAIWQPLEILAVNGPIHSLQHSQQNALASACKHFLDIFESLDSPKSRPSTAIQQFDFAQASFEHRAKTRVTDELIQKTSN
ncbi:hypothetical protein VTL71DRAFT_15416 [Oculimacula yallundae]|uniref:C2H2-type domain-containing protein n=1 Tax=Oculimacula yallundae TaxID=86028 RepID=A0ABR4CGJ5_9HELO